MAGATKAVLQAGRANEWVAQVPRYRQCFMSPPPLPTGGVAGFVEDAPFGLPTRSLLKLERLWPSPAYFCSTSATVFVAGSWYDDSVTLPIMTLDEHNEMLPRQLIPRG
jgi:hypothetical protein